MKQEGINKSATALRSLILHYAELKSNALTADEQKILKCYRDVKRENK